MADTRPGPAQRLQIARERMKIATASDAAARFGWNRDTYLQHENGTRGIVRAAKSYAKAFKVSEAWLLTGTGPGPGEHAVEIEDLLAIYQGLPDDEARAELMRSAATISLAAKARQQSRKDEPDPDGSGR